MASASDEVALLPEVVSELKAEEPVLAPETVFI